MAKDDRLNEERQAFKLERGSGSAPSMKAVAALRNQFGGHAVKAVD